MKEIAEFGNNLFILKSQKSSSCIENVFPEKMIGNLLKSNHFLKFGMKREEKKFG